MRYYPLFRGAIPHSRVGYPRVTHPFAARLADCSAASLDLHVLGAPPAFILSQDQTLRFEPVNAADPVVRWDHAVRYSLVLQCPDEQDTVAPHARFSFQRTSTRPSRRTSSVGAVRWFVNPRVGHLVTAVPEILSSFKEQPRSEAGDALYTRVGFPCQPPPSLSPGPALPWGGAVTPGESVSP
jgi:hypothetical protein